jgi:hypothetical protein
MKKISWLYLCLNYQFGLLEESIKIGDYVKERKCFEAIDSLVIQIDKLENKQIKSSKSL